VTEPAGPADATGSTARARLLAAVLEHARGGGLADVSLRALASAVGTSHRMLLYHFGSREGLVAAVVAAIEADQRKVLNDIAGDWTGDPEGAVRAFWADLADPSRHESERLFFEAVAMSLRGRPGTEGLRETLVEPWLAAAASAADRLGVPADEARAEARLGMAVTRGLLLDLLITGDRAGVDAALDRYVRGYVDPARPRPGPEDQPSPNTTVTDTATS